MKKRNYYTEEFMKDVLARLLESAYLVCCDLIDFGLTEEYFGKLVVEKQRELINIKKGGEE